MKKKIFTLLLAVAASIGTMFAWDYERFQGGDLFYNLDTTNRIAEVTYSSCEELIPGTGICLYNGNRTGIKSVNIPSQVTYNGITYNVTSIGDHAFHSCGLLASVYIPNSIITIGNDAFNSCNLKSLEIPNSVTSIGNMAFNENGLLTSVTIGTGLISVGGGVFRNCVALKDIYYTGTIDEWCSKAWNPGNLIAGYRLFINNSEINDVVIPNSVTSIGDGAFSGCSSLTSVTIPNSVTNIGDAAFARCSSLPSISIPNSVTNIGSSAFQGSNITSVVIGNRSVNIGAYAFMGCGNLVNVTYGSFSSTANQNSVISIGNYAFDGCSSLTSFVITDNVNVIGGYAFNNCNNLKSITIGENVDSIGAYILAKCKKLKSITWNAKNCKDFNIYGPNYPPLTLDKTYENISSLIIGDKVERVPAYLCRYCQTANNQDIDSIICLGIKPAKLGKDALISAYYGHNQQSSIYVPCGTVGLYQTCWSTFATKIQNNNCSSNEDLYFRVLFEDWNYDWLSEQVVEKGHAATAPANPTREGYTFTGWDKDFSNVQSNLTVYAQYTPNTPSTTYYTVTFKDWNGTILKSEQVEKGHSATAPANPTREGYTFTGWDKDFSNVQSNLTITAQYQKNETPVTNAITVRLKASSATGWSKVNLYYWADGITSPAWPGITISRDADGWYSHTFDASVTSVNIIWNDGNNQTVDITNVTESTCYSLKSTSGKTIGVNVVECQAAAPVSVTGVSLNKKTLQMVVGNTATLTASVLPANASNKSVTWTSSNTATATISATGTISAKAEGVTTITCKTVDGNFTAECYLVVSAANSEYTFSYEPTNATVINYTATELSYNEIPENNCVFAALADNAHTLNLMYVGSLVNGKIPQGNYKITSTLQNGTFCYSVGGVDQYDYGSYMATDFDSEGYYTSAYYIIAGDITIESKNNYTVKVVSANGTDINVTYAGTQDVEIVPSEIKASKILRNGQIYILRGEKEYTLTGQEVK